MAKKRYINTKFWSDNYISELDPIEKLLFIYFITNPYTDICGIYEISLKQMALDTGIDQQEMLPKIINRFSLDDKIYYIDGWVYVKNFQKHQAVNESVLRGIERSLQDVPCEIMAQIKHITQNDPTLPPGCPPPATNLTKLNLTKPIEKFADANLVGYEELIYEPLKGNKTRKAFANRERSKKGKPALLRNNPEAWSIINLYQRQYKYITGKTALVSEADYFHILSITKKLSPQDMDAMIIWYVKMDNQKFKAHPSLKSIFTVENINKFNLQK
jgi:hypothetical protein